MNDFQQIGLPGQVDESPVAPTDPPVSDPPVSEPEQSGADGTPSEQPSGDGGEEVTVAENAAIT